MISAREGLTYFRPDGVTDAIGQLSHFVTRMHPVDIRPGNDPQPGSRAIASSRSGMDQIPGDNALSSTKPGDNALSRRVQAP
jgi:hypothetical protein